MPARLRLLLGALGAALYALASLWLMTHHPDAWPTLLVVLGPMTGGALVGLWRRGARGAALALAAGAGLVALLVTRGDGPAAPYLYLLQHVGVHLALAGVFGLTLRTGQVPLITRLAVRLMRPAPALAGFTRRVTVVWAAYFAAMATVSVLLFAWNYAAWSWFANVATPLGVVALFGAEYGVRRLLHPEFETVGMAAAWQAYRDDAAGVATVTAAAPTIPERVARG